MKVERPELFDFKVILDPEEFSKVKRIADNLGIGIDHAFHLIVERGMDFVLEDIFDKET